MFIGAHQWLYYCCHLHERIGKLTKFSSLPILFKCMVAAKHSPQLNASTIVKVNPENFYVTQPVKISKNFGRVHALI